MSQVLNKGVSSKVTTAISLVTDEDKKEELTPSQECLLKKLLQVIFIIFH